MTPAPLNQRRHALLMYINAQLATTSLAPSHREMAAHTDMCLAEIHREVSWLVDHGYLRRLPCRARALDVVRLPDGFVVRIA